MPRKRGINHARGIESHGTGTMPHRMMKVRHLCLRERDTGDGSAVNQPI